LLRHLCLQLPAQGCQASRDGQPGGRPVGGTVFSLMLKRAEILLWDVKPVQTDGDDTADLVRTILFQDDVDAAKQLSRDSTHAGAPRLALFETTLEEAARYGFD
jgi:hypothetical protein